MLLKTDVYVTPEKVVRKSKMNSLRCVISVIDVDPFRLYNGDVDVRTLSCIIDELQSKRQC